MTASAPRSAFRAWIAPALLPVVNLALALLLSGLVVLAVGENPARALWLLASGAFGGAEAIGYTLYYATSFVFTGLAVAVAFHAGLFNIGAEGQAYLGGLAVALLCPGRRRLADALVVAAAMVVAAAAARPGRSCPRGSRRGAAATSSSPRSCSTSSPRR
jgi:simple sugar transport system permease protein